MRQLTVFVFLGTILTISILRADGETAVPIPFWERPDYILETPDVIEIKVVSETISEDRLVGISGTHLIGPDGHIGLKGQMHALQRLAVQDLTIARCENAVFEWLSKELDSESFEVRVKVYSCNSKEFHIVYTGQGGEQRISFPFTGHETVVKAIKCCNGLAPGSSPKFLLLRAPKAGKPVEMTPIDYNEAVDDPKKDVALRSGDTILIRQDFRGEDLRPDGPIISTTYSEPDGESDDMLVSEADYEIPTFELDEPVAKTASQAVPTPTKGGKRIARTVFWANDSFDAEQFLGEHFFLLPLKNQIESETSMSIVFQSDAEKPGVWLILFGDEETVTELQTVFEKIAGE